MSDHDTTPGAKEKGVAAAKTAARGAKKAGRGAKKVGKGAKVVWDNGGKQTVTAGVRTTKSANGRRKARTHATTLVGGSVVKVIHQGAKHYVVFSGDKPVATYPPTSVPVETLLANADLTKRLRKKRG